MLTWPLLGLLVFFTPYSDLVQLNCRIFGPHTESSPEQKHLELTPELYSP